MSNRLKNNSGFFIIMIGLITIASGISMTIYSSYTTGFSGDKGLTLNFIGFIIIMLGIFLTSFDKQEKKQ